MTPAERAALPCVIAKCGKTPTTSFDGQPIPICAGCLDAIRASEDR